MKNIFKPLVPAIWSLLVVAGLFTPAAALPGKLWPEVTGDARLSELRAQQRRSVRTASLAAAGKSAGASFGLLVIPVDFADQRFSEAGLEKSLAARVFGSDSEALSRYFSVASGGRMKLSPQLAPVVHLAGPRADYSDIGWHGFSRSRALAREALTALADLGLDFALVDADGPDGLPGSGDDDGQVDGVLILHAGPGQENDPESGLIQALQFYLDQAVYSRGIGASFYATVSISSGPGVWAHEVGHLLGMEDRYDPTLAPSGQSEVVSRGGLGIFSLMAAGAWGTGDGHGAALPDGYTLLEMGWAPVEDLTPYRDGSVVLLPVSGGGCVGRMQPVGQTDAEYFLLEVRDPSLVAPFDAALPAGQMVVYHVDPALADGQRALDDLAGWHLRVGVVEADGNDSLHDGLDTGGAGDVFPGLGQRHDLPAVGKPGFSGYGHQAPGFSLSGITDQDGQVSFTVVPDPVSGLEFSFDVDPGGQAAYLEARATGRPFQDLACAITVEDTAWGSFDGGRASLFVSLADDGTGLYRPLEPLVWMSGPEPPAGASTEFSFGFTAVGDSFPAQHRQVVWKQSPADLDFRTSWPGTWQVAAGAGTTWQRWAGQTGGPFGSGGILACTGDEFSTGAAWPEVHYGNRADAALVSAPLEAGVMGIRLVHAVEAEVLSGAVAMDGGNVRWRGAGLSVPAVPIGGYEFDVSPRADNVLKGQGVFAGDSLSFQEGQIIWRVDVFSVPAEPPEVWRLELDFGSNGLWRRRGWFVSSIEPVYDLADLLPFAAGWDTEGCSPSQLRWQWPWPDQLPGEFQVQVYDPSLKSWSTVGAVAVVPGAGVQEAVLSGMVGSGQAVLRLLAAGPPGWVATPPVAMVDPGSAAAASPLGRVWPNPGQAPIRFETSLASDAAGRMAVYDLRGRLVREMDLPAGQAVGLWDGTDSRGGPAPAGMYVMRLEGLPAGGVRKVVLLR